MAKAKPTYQEMADELENILLDLQREDLDIDQAVQCYERGLELVGELEKYLEQAENRISELKSGPAGS